MRPPAGYSASPLYSFCTVPTEHVLSFGVTLHQVVAWLRGVGPGWRQLSKEAQVIDEMARLMSLEVEAEAAAPSDSYEGER